MLRAVKTAMQLCALLCGAAVSIGIHAIMPKVPWYQAWFYFLMLGLCFSFACTLAIASLLIGEAPRRSKLGAMLNTKVNQQTREGEDVHGRITADTKRREASATEAAMPRDETK